MSNQTVNLKHDHSAAAEVSQGVLVAMIDSLLDIDGLLGGDYTERQSMADQVALARELLEDVRDPQMYDELTEAVDDAAGNFRDHEMDAAADMVRALGVWPMAHSLTRSMPGLLAAAA